MLRYLPAAACLVAFWCAPPDARSADTSPLILQHLTALEGLPQGTVMASLQDSQGFVWLGTEDGLVRFDGHDLHRYAYSRSSQDGLPGNFVNAIAEDAHGDLWLAIKGAGLAQWHRGTDSFTAYRHDPSNPASLSSDAVRTVLIDAHGRVWAGTLDAGVNVLAPDTGSILHLNSSRRDGDSLSDDRIQALMQDRRGDVWIGTHAGLDRWRLDGERFVREPLATPADPTLGSRQIMQIYEDARNTFWVGTLDAGLYHLDRTGRVLQRYSHEPADSASLVSNDVRAILEDHAGRLWVGTEDGLDLLDRSTNRFGHYRHDKEDRDSLTDSFIMSLYEDGSGLLWIGTRTGGVSRWDPRSWELGANRPPWLEGKLVTSFADDADHGLWVGSMGGGLVHVDTRTGDWKNIDGITNRPDALGERRVMSLHQDGHGNLWIGTMAGGLKELTAGGEIVSFPVNAGDPRGLSAAGIMTIYEARSGLLWIGTHGGGANILDPATGLIRQLPHISGAAGSITSENVTSFAEDKDGNMWIGTDGGGLDLASADGTVRAAFIHDPAAATSLSANTVYSLAIDSRGEIWIATDGGGLDRVVGSAAQPGAIAFQNMSRSTGLSSDTIYGVLTDSDGRLWMSGNAGLMRYDPLDSSVKTYHREHGLQGEEFNFGAYHRMRDGRLCFGGPGGYNVFDPSALSPSRAPPRLALTRVEILGAAAPGTTPYWALSKVALDYQASIVSFDFAALDFASPNRTRVAYRMRGLSDKWIDLGTERRVTLTNLESGDHILEVRAANEDSAWSESPLELVIHKTPGPWQSVAAFVSYAIVAVLLIILAILAHRKKFREASLAQQRLEAEVLVRTQELRDANQRLVVASEAKSSFLARMGHELRTPMNGVVGMTELLARTPLSPVQARHTQTIKSSAQALLRILNDLLDLSKAQAGKVVLEAIPVDFTRLTEECATLFSGIAESKDLEVIVCPPVDDDFEVLADPLRLRQVLMNLIGNAVKFTAQGEVVVTCDIVRDGAAAAVRLSVADTGIGLSPESIKTIFEPFSQADESTTRRFGGSGLGLSICRELISLMDGSITVASEPGRGSTFVVDLRLRVGERKKIVGGPPVRRRIQLVTRRDAVAQSLSRYAARCQLAVEIKDGARPGPESDAVDAIIVDADSCPEAIDAFLSPSAACHAAILIAASPKAIHEHRLKSRMRSQRLIRKPICDEALRNAMAAVLGDGGDSPADSMIVKAFVGADRTHVLIVEDDSVNAAVAQGYLAELGCTSVWVTDGEAAVARQAIERFEIILMDLNMPGLDGYATAQLIRKAEPAGPGVPIIALTAAGANRYREACLAAGMDDILSKPYTLAEFASVLRRWTRRGDTDLAAAAAAADAAAADAAAAAVAAARPASLSKIDDATVAQLRKLGRGNQADLYSKLVLLFTRTSRETLAGIGKSLADADLEAARALSHKLKAGAANVGALQFSEGVAELERCCERGDADVSRRVYERLAGAYPSLIEELTRGDLRATA